MWVWIATLWNLVWREFCVSVYEHTCVSVTEWVMCVWQTNGLLNSFTISLFFPFPLCSYLYPSLFVSVSYSKVTLLYDILLHILCSPFHLALLSLSLFVSVLYDTTVSCYTNSLSWSYSLNSSLLSFLFCSDHFLTPLYTLTVFLLSVPLNFHPPFAQLRSVESVRIPISFRLPLHMLNDLWLVDYVGVSVPSLFSPNSAFLLAQLYESHDSCVLSNFKGFSH